MKTVVKTLCVLLLASLFLLPAAAEGETSPFSILRLRLLDTYNNVITAMADGRFNVDAVIKNNSYDGPCKIMLVGYDEDGRLKEMRSYERNNSWPIGTNFTYYLPFKNLDLDIKCVKAFVFSAGEEMKPLAESLKIAFSEPKKTYEGLDFYEIDDGKAYGVRANDGFYNIDLEIPEYYKGKPVTEIDDNAFEDLDIIKNVIFTGWIKTIGEDAFKDCDCLENVYYKGYESSWVDISFANRQSNPLYSAKQFFINSKLITDLSVPTGVTAISDYAFVNYKGFTSITLPSGLKTIGTAAFENSSAKTANIPSSVNCIKPYAFYGCNCSIDFKNRSEWMLDSTNKDPFNYYYSYKYWGVGKWDIGSKMLSYSQVVSALQRQIKVLTYRDNNKTTYTYFDWYTETWYKPED